MNSLMDVVTSLASAKKAAESWASLDASLRADFLTKISQHLRENEITFVEKLSVLEQFPADFCARYFVRPMARLFDSIAQELRESPISSRPTGLVALIMPSVTGFRVTGERLAPALAAGNVVIVKASSLRPGATLLWKEILESVALPEHVVAFLVGEGASVGDLLAKHPSVQAVSFAGRPRTASALLPGLAQMGKKLQISAGVKNSLHLHADTDLTGLEKILEPVLFGAGRLPWGLSRIFLPETRLEEFSERLQVLLDQKDFALPVGPRYSAAQWSEVQEQIRKEHGKPLAGGRREGEPFFVRDLTNCSTLQLEEVEGPLVIVTAVKYAHEMVKWTNTGDFGFCASWWGPEEKLHKLADRLDVGRVWLNGWLQDDSAFAGWKRSFFGNPDFSWQGSFFSNVK